MSQSPELMDKAVQQDMQVGRLLQPGGGGGGDGVVVFWLQQGLVLEAFMRRAPAVEAFMCCGPAVDLSRAELGL